MPKELVIIQWLQQMQSPFFDTFWQVVTLFGDELFFIVVAAAFYWCVDKRSAFKLMNVYLLSVSVNEGFKSLFHRTRPYDNGAVSIGDKTSGYSFPSGHSQSVANLSTQIYLRSGEKRKILLPFLIAVTTAVMVSRLYLGQHYLTDVLFGAAFGISFALLFSMLYDFLGNGEEWILAVVLPLSVLGLILMCALGLDKTAPEVLTVLGAYGALAAGYFMEKRFVRYRVRSGKLWKQFLKFIIGISLTLALKEGLKFILPQSVPALYQYLRYFLVALWASLGSMALFKAIKL